MGWRSNLLLNLDLHGLGTRHLNRAVLISSESFHGDRPSIQNGLSMAYIWLIYGLYMGKSTNEMSIFNSKLLVYQRVCRGFLKWGSPKIDSL